MKLPWLQLCAVTLMPVAASALLWLLDTKTPFGRMKFLTKQIIFGLVFGALAVVGTEWGIPYQGAVLNARDGAVLTAGLMFGWPAGLIAGVIGGAERWFAVAWGVGSFTRVACSVSTCLAGIYAAALRKFMFEDRRPGWLLSFAVGVVMEIVHLAMVFLTNMDQPTLTMQVVKVCTAPMVIANALAVMLSAIALTLLSREGLSSRGHRSKPRINRIIQRWLLVAVTLAFVFTSFFVYRLQDTIASVQTDHLLTQALDDVANEISDTSDQNLLSLTRRITGEATPANLDELARRYDVAEISIIDRAGVITASTVPEFVGFDMKEGGQSAAFLCLLEPGAEEYVQDFGPISYNSSVWRKYAGHASYDGFVQVGMNSAQLRQGINDEIGWVTTNRHVGETGFVMVLDADRRVISIPQTASAGEDEILSLGLGNLDETFRSTLGGQKTFCRAAMTEGYYLVSVLPEEEALQMRNIALYVNAFMEIIVFAVLFGLIYRLIERAVVAPIHEVNRSLERITGGDLDETVSIRTSVEFDSLSDGINSTVDTLKKYIAEASARIDAELEFAKSIQSSALPSSFPAFPRRRDIDIYASMTPAREVGGDFYDFYLTDNDTLNFMIADVSGKGIPAAMFMMRAKTELKTLTEEGRPLAEVFTTGNEALCEGNDAGMFVTAWQGSVDLAHGRMTYVNAGHNPPLIRRAGGQFEFLRSKAAFVLGGMDGMTYKSLMTDIEPGDIVCLYTDGVTEAENEAHELFGEERLLEAVNGCGEIGSMQELLETIRAAVNAFVGTAPQFDDITMLAFRYEGEPCMPTVSFERATLDDVSALSAFIERELDAVPCPKPVQYALQVAADEIFSNIVTHGYGDDPGPIEVRLVEKVDPHRVYLRFSDNARPYNPMSAKPPEPLRLDFDREGGLGIFMVTHSMDDVKYKYENGTNVLTFMKLLDKDTQ